VQFPYPGMQPVPQDPRTRAAKSPGDVADFVVISRAAQSVRGVAIVVERQRRRSSRSCGGWREGAISILTVLSAAEIQSRAARARTLAAAITLFAAALLVTGRRAAFAVESRRCGRLRRTNHQRRFPRRNLL
jgi:hypothetical protein